ncbi:FAD-dependent oxidoreductase [Nonomuraea angiospora]
MQSRTIEDSLALRAQLSVDPGNVVVIGGGFIGGEVASTARPLGLPVTLVDAAPYPMSNVLGTEAARWLAGHHRNNGVELVGEARVTGFEGTGRATGVRLSNGRTLPADLVIAGMGVVPNTEWLEGSGLTLGDGVVCDERLFALGTSDVVAAGEPATPRRHQPRHRRIAGGGPVRRRLRQGRVLVGAVAVNSHKDLIRIKRAIVAGDPLDALL